jgi:hypothetical protein
VAPRMSRYETAAAAFEVSVARGVPVRLGDVNYANAAWLRSPG